MFRIDPTGIQQRIAELDEIERTQLPYALMVSLNKTAEYVNGALVDEMRSVFDRPTPFTLNATRVIYATKQKLESRVWVKNLADRTTPATKWLLPEIEGGSRNDKGSEALLRRRGILPSGQYVVPGKGAKLDSHGNISRGQLTRALAAVKGLPKSGGGAQRSSRGSGRFFVMMKGNRPLGIAERTGKSADAVQVLLAFVSRPSYHKRFDFYGVAQRAAELRLPVEFESALALAMATRRR